ncbi:hydantoinase/oxoprolinase family protein [Streptomyces sp. KL116D]|uniref:hydantoinase/oxoprolinase family protein n=1 Tax=Streptomyces sp. KL116D TaxID=3045152 RepID=UPI0035586C6F
MVDVGGTTADVGILQGGFPREAAGESEAAGIRTNFRIPDVLSLGIGGGRWSARTARRARALGRLPGLTEEALVFGGATLTATDLAVAAGAPTSVTRPGWPTWTGSSSTAPWPGSPGGSRRASTGCARRAGAAAGGRGAGGGLVAY